MSGSDGINQRDADVIAKAIRNNTDLSASQKEGVAIDIANYLLRFRHKFCAFLPQLCYGLLTFGSLRFPNI